MREENDGCLGVLIWLIFLLITEPIGAFINPAVAARSLRIQGYTNVEIIDHSWLFVGFRGCGMDDSARFTAKAKNPAGKDVELYVCTGIFKGATIRTD